MSAPYVGRHRREYCPPPTDRLCGCNQCRSEWAEREADLEDDPPRCWSCRHRFGDGCECNCCNDQTGPDDWQAYWFCRECHRTWYGIVPDDETCQDCRAEQQDVSR